MKKIVIILAILISVLIPACIVYKTMITPSQLIPILPNKSNSDSLKTIIIKINKKGNYFINGNRTAFSEINTKIDSLAILGLRDSIIILDSDVEVEVSKIIQIIDLVKETNRKIIIKTNPIITNE